MQSYNLIEWFSLRLPKQSRIFSWRELERCYRTKRKTTPLHGCPLCCFQTLEPIRHSGWVRGWIYKPPPSPLSCLHHSTCLWAFTKTLDVRAMALLLLLSQKPMTRGQCLSSPLSGLSLENLFVTDDVSKRTITCPYERLRAVWCPKYSDTAIDELVWWVSGRHYRGVVRSAGINSTFWSFSSFLITTTSFGFSPKWQLTYRMALCPLCSKIPFAQWAWFGIPQNYHEIRWMSVPSLLQNSKYGSRRFHDESSCEKLPKVPSRRKMETRN